LNLCTITELEETRQKLNLIERVAVIMCGASTVIVQTFTTEYEEISNVIGKTCHETYKL